MRVDLDAPEHAMCSEALAALQAELKWERQMVKRAKEKSDVDDDLLAKASVEIRRLRAELAQANEAVCGEPTGPDSATTEQRNRSAHRAQSVSPTAREGQTEGSTDGDVRRSPHPIPETKKENER